MGSVLSSTEVKVSRYCGVSDVPAIVGVVSGRVTHFRQHMGSSRDILNFLARIIPSGVVTEVSSPPSSNISETYFVGDLFSCFTRVLVL